MFRPKPKSAEKKVGEETKPLGDILDFPKIELKKLKRKNSAMLYEEKFKDQEEEEGKETSEKDKKGLRNMMDDLKKWQEMRLRKEKEKELNNEIRRKNKEANKIDTSPRKQGGVAMEDDKSEDLAGGKKVEVKPKVSPDKQPRRPEEEKPITPVVLFEKESESDMVIPITPRNIPTKEGERQPPANAVVHPAKPVDDSKFDISEWRRNKVKPIARPQLPSSNNISQVIVSENTSVVSPTKKEPIKPGNAKPGNDSEQRLNRRLKEVVGNKLQTDKDKE
jgi:hypothetical protein